MKLLPTPKPVSLRKLLVGALVRSVFISVALVAPTALVQHFLPLNMDVRPAPHGVAAEPSKADRLLERNGCWTEEVPSDMEGVFPGHVVYSKPGSGARLGGTKVVGAAFDQIFEDVDNDLTVYGFCR